MLIRAAAFCLAASPAIAECVTSDDMSNGIRATLDNGVFEDFRSAGTNMVEMTIDFGDGLIGRDTLVHGIYLTEIGDYEAGVLDRDSWVNVAFPVAFAEMPVPAPNTSWEVVVNGRDSLGAFTETQTYRWGELTTKTLGKCTYDMIPGTVRAGEGNNWSIEEIHYLPTLGIGLQISYRVEGEPAFPPSVYRSLKRLGPSSQ